MFVLNKAASSEGGDPINSYSFRKPLRIGMKGNYGLKESWLDDSGRLEVLVFRCQLKDGASLAGMGWVESAYIDPNLVAVCCMATPLLCL